MLEMGTAISAIKALYEAANMAIQARDDAKLKSVMLEMQGRLMDAMEAAINSAEKVMALQEALRSAKEECAELQAKTHQRERYKLAQLPGQGQQYAYASQPGTERENEPPHYLCQTCFDKGIKSVLQVQETSDFGTEYRCTGCKTQLWG